MSIVTMMTARVWQSLFYNLSEVWKGEFVDIRETDTVTNEAIVCAIIKEEPRKVKVRI